MSCAQNSSRIWLGLKSRGTVLRNPSVITPADRGHGIAFLAAYLEATITRALVFPVETFAGQRGRASPSRTHGGWNRSATCPARAWLENRESP